MALSVYPFASVDYSGAHASLQVRLCGLGRRRNGPVLQNVQFVSKSVDTVMVDGSMWELVVELRNTTPSVGH